MQADGNQIESIQGSIENSSTGQKELKKENKTIDYEDQQDELEGVPERQRLSIPDVTGTTDNLQPKTAHPALFGATKLTGSKFNIVNTPSIIREATERSVIDPHAKVASHFQIRSGKTSKSKKEDKDLKRSSNCASDEDDELPSASAVDRTSQSESLREDENFPYNKN